MTAKTTTVEEDPRLDAPLVYPDRSYSDRWMVRPPESLGATDPVAFNGPNACRAALEFAYSTYGCARHFSA